MSEKMRECPACAMEISSAEVVCPICGYEFPSRTRKNWSMTIAAVLLILLLLLIFLI